jgi:hypothetical protein
MNGTIRKNLTGKRKDRQQANEKKECRMRERKSRDEKEIQRERD